MVHLRRRRLALLGAPAPSPPPLCADAPQRAAWLPYFADVHAILFLAPISAFDERLLEDRRVKRFLADRTRGCICPPDLPVCGCGRVPQAELVFRRSVAPTPGEVADNPRSKSARLRAARKLTEEEVRA